jgi:23S rRNA pseudouridine2605 synthase
VFERLPALTNARWIAVGRLDVNTMGLLLFTTDGELAHRLMHPSSELDREYAIRVRGEIEPAVRQRLLDGVPLEDGPARFVSLEDAGGEGENHWYKGVIQEGRNREVRRLMESQGLQVARLIRLRFGSITLPRSLARGRTLELAPPAVAALAASMGLEVEQPRRRRRPLAKRGRPAAKRRRPAAQPRRRGRP